MSPPATILGRTADSLRSDSVGGLLLIAAAAAAIIWANSPFAASYEALRGFTVGPAALHLDLDLQTWAADGLLAVFFFIVGNELKQEFVHGELRDPRRAMLPIVAAVCGMAVPALVYAAITLGDPASAGGWGIPMATDIAFALAVLAVVGKGLPPALRTFLLTLAIVDDLGAVTVIAVFYTEHISFGPLLGAAAGLALFGYLQQGRRPAALLGAARVPAWAVYVPLAAVVWTLMHESGVHATIAGVAIGLLMRTAARPGEAESPSHRVEHLLRPWSAGLALPVFAFFAAGVAFEGLGAVLTDRAGLGIVAGLVGGKLLGILGGAWLTTKVTSATLNPSLSWWDIAGMSQLAGIGFTVSLLITELSFPDTPETLANAKAGVLLASLIASVLAAAVLTVRSRRYQREPRGSAG
ncbi:sodium/proton antiporter (NhaA family) [Murinocardiopsis flavida]|uniref:Na(+)/H(+) antiporter NhaA n=1 Tax=Murinocardiopsis flavida TaxID=645275 RepID=A0A2P8DDW1_9ACTN|nr:Na+/H+ antiporter NhaA [Murinocardiopsis flavida]PSK95379.1 sodium/proton antiporter (NhaA family) [Murinocardiopsis flavida]